MFMSLAHLPEWSFGLSNHSYVFLSLSFARYEEYGTSLKGLLAEGILDEKGAEMFHGSDLASPNLHTDCSFQIAISL